MAYYLRKIQNQRWLIPDDASWLRGGEIPADPLWDLRTQNNAMSVYHVDSDRRNLERIVAAMAVKSEYPYKPIDYLLIEDSIPVALGIRAARSEGKTGDPFVNENWHFDFIQLSSESLQVLLRNLWNTCESGRKTRREILHLVRTALESGNIAQAELHPNWQTEISGGRLPEG